MAATDKRKRVHARTMATAKQSTAATFRNIPAHNTIVMMQTTQKLCHKQRKRDDANNASVMMTNGAGNNGIVMSRWCGQGFVTFRYISSAYVTDRPDLYSTPVLCDSSGLALVRLYYSTPVLLCRYAHITISLYDHMLIVAYNGSVMKRYKKRDTTLAGSDTTLAGSNFFSIQP